MERKQRQKLDRELREQAIITTPQRLEIIKAKIDDPYTPSHKRLEILSFLLDRDTMDIEDWFIKLQALTEDWLNEPRR